ncbi:MAG: TonB-dependent receptor [Blastocatellia bacterium]|nr:TonB-dependent receptor [Blastocatellia bacterium]
MTKFFTIKFFGVVAIALLMGAGQVFAQSSVTGALGGRVADPQGAVVPNAVVTVTNVGTNATVTANADRNGAYRVANLQPGTYRVETSVAGFAPARAENVIVEVGQLTNIDIGLTIGDATAEVTVTGEAPVLNTVDPTNSTNINQTSINELPINGRRASNFVLLTPGVAPDGNFGLISFRGISGLLNNSTVDGGDNNQAFFSEERGRTRINYSISQDAVREFQVNTSNYSAEFGRAAGGVVNTVTKSGTNEFHGSAFYYLRDNRFGARNAFSFQSVSTGSGTQVVALKPKDERHQFGGSLGGPIVRDRLFFFFSYDQQIRDFPGVAAPGSPTFFTANIGPTGNLTPAQIQQGISYLQGLTGVVPRKGDQTLFLPKIDWIINDKHTFSAVYNRLRWDSPAGVQTQAVVSRGTNSFGSDLVSIDTLNLRLNSTLSPSVLNEFRFQYSRDLEQQIADPPGPGEPTTANGASPQIGIGGGSGITIGQPNFLNRAAYPDEKRWQVANSTTVSRGRHTVKFGADFNHVEDILDNLFRNAGEYSYSSLGLFLQDYFNPSCRRYSSFNQGFGPSRFEFSTRDYNFFIQDDIQVTPNLTLNFGMRYEYQQLPEPQIPNPLEPRTANFPSDKNNFGPRIGFALSFGDRNENVVRAGYGIFYGRIINSTISNAITNTGSVEGQRQVSLLPNNPAAPLYPNVLTAPPGVGGASDIVVFNQNMQNPLIHQADVIFERQIGRNMVISWTGMMSYGRYLPTFIDRNLNPANASTTFTFNGGIFAGQTLTLPRYSGPRPNTNFGRITEITGEVSSEYFGSVVQFNRRLTDGLQFQTSYTYSKAKDNGQLSQTFTTANAPLDPYNLNADYGTSNFDIPHRFVASLVYAPRRVFGLGGDDAFGRAIFGGWTIAPIFTAQSGSPYSATVSGNAPGGTSFGILGAGGFSRLPNLERNAFRAPSIYTMDLRISRRFRFTERMNLEFLAEGFNIFNRNNITGVNSRAYLISGTNLNADANFGVPTAGGNSIFRERQIQFATRFQF